MSATKPVVLLTVIGLLGALTYGVLFTEIGVFVVGYRFWMSLAAHTDDTDTRIKLVQRALDGTQYGVNQAENWTRDHKNGEQRLELWRALIEAAPNEGWRDFYGARLRQDIESSATPSNSTSDQE